MISDELVGAAAAGDQLAVDALLAAVRTLVVRYCRACLGAADADDVAREACLAVLAELPTHRGRGRGRPFLALVHLVTMRAVAAAERSAPGRAGAGTVPGELGALLRTLPHLHREILILRIAVGLTVDETAEAVGSTPQAVRLAQHHALTGLRQGMPAPEDPATGSVPPARAVRPR